MATRKPRIILTVEPEVNELLQDLYKHTGKPKATFLSDLLNEALPALYQLREALDNIEDKKAMMGNIATMTRMANISHMRVTEEVLDVLEQIDWVEDVGND